MSEPHYRIALIAADGSVLASIHKDFPSVPVRQPAWAGEMRAHRALWAQISVCDKEPCPDFEAWRARKHQQEDDIEAEHLRGESHGE